jgi:cytoskeletal protein CcmA (bactofilin family)
MAMFGNSKDAQNTAELSGANTHIAKGATLTGDIETYGTVRIEGKIYGNLKSKGKASIGEGSFVQGNILAQSAEIAGEVNGTVEIAEILTLKASAVIRGDITCNKLIVEMGAAFNGKCMMGATSTEIIIQDIPSTSPKISEKTKSKTNSELETPR